MKDNNLIRLYFKNQSKFLEYSKFMFPGTTHHGGLLLDKIMIYICTAFSGANWCKRSASTLCVRASADVVANKLGIIFFLSFGANVARAHARFACEGGHSGH